MTGCDRDTQLKVLARFLFNRHTTVLPDAVIPWYEKHQWKAEEFFDDPKVIALCKTIEAGDLAAIDRLVAEGADVNAKGKGNMTPLLWAFPENKPEVFKRILEHGADPNVRVTSDFDTDWRISPGHSVLHLAADTAFPNYFKYVMQHGGDPNLIRERLLNPERLIEGHWFPHHSPLIAVIRGRCPDKKEAVQLLIDAGADLNYRTDTNERALCTSVSAGLFSITLQLLEAGADFNFLKEGGSTFVHFLLSSRERVWSITTLEDREYYDKVLEWLKTNGTDLEGARNDNR